jgi:uncharacterized protein YegP (UPF0339 family)
VNTSSDLEFVIFRDSLGEWRWRLMRNRDVVLAFGAAAFKSCEECVNGIYEVMGARRAHPDALIDSALRSTAGISPVLRGRIALAPWLHFCQRSRDL